MLSLQSFLREGRVVGPCWENQNLKDLKACCGSLLRKGEVFAYVGQNQNLKDLKDKGLTSPGKRLGWLPLSPTDLTPPHTIPHLVLVGCPWLELSYFNYGIP